MRRPRFTISRWMAATAAAGLNIGVARAFVIAEGRGEHLDLVAPIFLIFFALQLGLWRYLSTQGRRRRFWLGFEAIGGAATLALSIGFLFNEGFNNWYTGVACDLSYLCLPARLDVALTHEHWDWFLALICFIPELIVAALGGVLSAGLFGVMAGVRPVPGVPTATR